MKYGSIPMNCKSYLILLVALFTLGIVQGQPYANEWIDHNQTYYKFKVSDDGVYRVTRNTLQQAGFPIATVSASRIQLFRQGEEIAISVNTQNDGTINYFDFYAQKNSGSGDTELYVDEDAQVNPYYSLFSDSASYFITYYLSNQSGKRVSFYSEANTDGIAADEFYYSEQVSSYSDNYNSGASYGSGYQIASTLYDFGEGWTSNFVTRNNSLRKTISLRNPASSFEEPILQLMLVAGNNNAHDVTIEVGPSDGNLRSIGTVNFSGRENRYFEEEIEWSDINSNGDLVVSITPNGVSGNADRMSLSYIRVIHPSTFDMETEDSFEMQLRTNGFGKSFIRVLNPPDETNLWDVTDPTGPIRIGINQSSSNFLAIIRNTHLTRDLLAFTNATEISNINEITFEDIPASGFNYLIISHPNLRTGDDQVAAYADYRSSEAGGGFNVHITHIGDLYDQFNYGDPSPLAIKRYADFMLDTNDPRYLFIIGKGVTPAADYYRQNSADLDYVQYIPAYGTPGSDVPFTAGLNGTTFENAIPTGRINVSSGNQISNYLEKVKLTEALSYDIPWRKKLLHLSGGRSKTEQTSFKEYTDEFKEVAEGDFLGGKVKTLTKSTTDEVEFIDVVDEINDGVSLVTFFGHSANTTADIDIGYVSNPVIGYDNVGKYPVFLINGCNAGSIFNTNNSYTWGDNWILTPEIGAVSFIASVGAAFSSNLKRYSDLFYEYAFAREEDFGKGVGDAMKSAAVRYLELYGSGELSIAQIQQFIINGDPAVKIFGENRPDFEITEAGVSFESLDNSLILASTDTFAIHMIVHNYGMTSNDSLSVAITRTLPNGTSIDYPIGKYAGLLSQDTLVFEVYNDPEIEVSGSNIFEITIDPTNEFEEFNEENNQVLISFDIYSGTTSHLHPLNYGIVPEEDVTLKFQLSNVLSDEKEILIELDSTQDFTSTWKKSTTVTTNLYGQWNVNLDITSLSDNQVFYWRSRLLNPAPDENDQFVTSSFTYIEGSPAGWMQSSSAQLESAESFGVLLENDGIWRFNTSETTLDVRTGGKDSPENGNADVLINDRDYTQNIANSPCNSNSINIMVFDRRSTQPYQALPFFNEDVFNRLVCGVKPQTIYNLLEKDVIGVDSANGGSVTRRFEDVIENAREGDHVLVFNMGDVNYSLWDTDIYAALNDIGVNNSQLDGIIDGQPLIILGKKGSAIGSADVVLDNDGGNPLLEQVIDLSSTILGSSGEGSIKSLKIGPVHSWISFTQAFDQDGEDFYASSIYGIQEDRTFEIKSNLTETVTDLSDIEVDEYPSIEIQSAVEDPIELTSPQIQSWKVLFEELPDGIIIDQSNAVSVQEGESVSYRFGFYNYTEREFDEDVIAIVQLRNRELDEIKLDTITQINPSPGDTSFFTASFETLNFTGISDLSVSVNTGKVPELYSSNNNLRKLEMLTVTSDKVNPVLDVTVNGKYLKNGDLISPNPVIVAKMSDTNPYIFKTDTIGMFLFYKAPCDSTCEFQRIFFSDENLNWSPASATDPWQLIYTPQDLIDGTHTIKIEVQDGSGNRSGLPYEKELKVLSTTSILDMMVFPNPSNSGFRVSFNAAGVQPPDEMIIKIFDVNGKKVRKLTFTDLLIGQNISEPFWDGTDESGRAMSNGIYFYQIYFNLPDGRMKYSLFDNDVGRLYLLR